MLVRVKVKSGDGIVELNPVTNKLALMLQTDSPPESRLPPDPPYQEEGTMPVIGTSYKLLAVQRIRRVVLPLPLKTK